jgi:hypothetical protein
VARCTNLNTEFEFAEKKQTNNIHKCTICVICILGKIPKSSGIFPECRR